MKLDTEFDARTDQRAYVAVAVGAAGLSYAHARAFFLPFMGSVGATITPLLLDAVVYWLAAANVRQAKAGRPLPMLRLGAYALMAVAVAANALAGHGWAERLFLGLPAALFAFLVECRTRLALYQHRAAHGDDRLRARLWLRHPIRAAHAWLYLARQHAPAFDRANAERDQQHAARDAIALALPGTDKASKRARAGVLRELAAGRLTAEQAVKASGLLTAPGVHELHRAALIASLGAGAQPSAEHDSEPDTTQAWVVWHPPQPVPWPNDEPTEPEPAPALPRPGTPPALPPAAAAPLAKPRRPGGKPGADTALKVTRLASRHPDWTHAQLAERLGISDRTVRRHLTDANNPTEAEHATA